MNQQPFISIATSGLKKIQHDANEMQSIIELNAGAFKTDLNAVNVLKTICKLESSFGQNCIPRLELSYYPSGFYFSKSKLLKEAWDNWGALVSFSYGPFQLLYCKAIELGFPLNQSPLDLWSGHNSCVLVVEILNDMNCRGIKTISEILSVYNGGLGALKRPTDGNKKYVQNGVAIYERL